MKSPRLTTAAVLSAAIGLALAVQAVPIQSQAAGMMKLPPGANKQVVERNRMLAKKYHLHACYGINAAYKNDCAAGAHSCAGQASVPRDPKSFVLLPAGDCAKIQGGSLKAG